MVSTGTVPGPVGAQGSCGMLRRSEQVSIWLMPGYSPIDVCVPLQVSLSHLASIHWSTHGIAADFVLPDDEASLTPG
jgi:hypothetical protein